MDVQFARLARRSGCAKCVWFKASTSQEDWGYCMVGAPRTSGSSPWPQIRGDNWCREWLPVDDEPDTHEVADRIPGSAPVIR